MLNAAILRLISAGEKESNLLIAVCDLEYIVMKLSNTDRDEFWINMKTLVASCKFLFDDAL